jgi:hypothetical protein
MTRPTRIALAVVILASVAGATTIRRETTAQSVDRSEVVCHVRCEDVEARLDRRLGIVFTYVELRCIEDFKGRTGARTFRLRLAGGRDGKTETVVPGMPRFRVGEECVLLLGKPNRDGYRTVVRARAGVLRLKKDERGRMRLRGAISGFESLANRTNVPASDFGDAVRNRVREQARRRGSEAR